MAHPTDRRAFLRNSALLGAAGAGSFLSLEEKALGSALAGGVADDSSPQPAYQGAPLPRGTLGTLSVSRLILGGNLIGGYAHSRDLLYVSNLLRAYNTDEKIFETLDLAERSGINTIQISPGSFDVVRRYREEHGGKIQMIVCIHPDSDESKVRGEIRTLIDGGAEALYTHGEVSDRCVMLDDIGPLARAVELIKAEGVPAGIGSHSLQTTIASERLGLDPDYYVKTFHPDTYWSATPEEDREEWCWYKGRSQDHDGYHDNMFCLNPVETEAFMKAVTKPWLAFKVMAAGAVNPHVGFTFAYSGGADFVIAGMFDFQVAADVELAVKAIRRAGSRERPWVA